MTKTDGNHCPCGGAGGFPQKSRLLLKKKNEVCGRPVFLVANNSKLELNSGCPLEMEPGPQRLFTILSWSLEVFGTCVQVNSRFLPEGQILCCCLFGVLYYLDWLCVSVCARASLADEVTIPISLQLSSPGSVLFWLCKQHAAWTAHGNVAIPIAAGLFC